MYMVLQEYYSTVKLNFLESCAIIAMVHGISMQSCPKTMNSRKKKKKQVYVLQTPTMTRGNTRYIPAFAIKGRGTRTTDNTPSQTHQPTLKDEAKLNATQT